MMLDPVTSDAARKLSEAVRPILIVDDDSDVRNAVADLLEFEGYHVHAVERGQDAIHQVRQFPYAAVILDMRLPDLDGRAVLRFMLQLDPNLPVVVLTGDRSEEYTIGSLTQGAFAYLTKPYNSQEVTTTIRRAVAHRGLKAKADQIQNELHRSEVQFHSVVESALDGIIVADDMGRILSWNSAAARMFHYSPAEVLGQSLTMLMPARYRAAHTQGLGRLRANGKTGLVGKTLELEGLRKEGTEFPLELSLASWKADGLNFYSGIIRDISERRHAEAVIRDSRRKYQTLVDAIDGIVWEMDPDSLRFTFVSQQCERLFGYPPTRWTEELTWQDLIFAEDVDRLVALRRQAVAQRRNHDSEYRMRAADGRIVWVKDVASVVIEQDRVIKICGVLLDITERKRAEAALHDSEQRFEQLAETIHEVFWMSDPEKNEILYVSPAYAEIWGRTCRSLYEAPRSWLEAIHPEDRGRVLQAALTKQVSGEYSEEYRIVRPDGVIRWIHDRAFPVRDADGKIHRITGIAEDITARKEAQTALRKTYDKMETILASLPGAILITDDQQHIVYANAVANQQFGTAQPLVGRPISAVLPVTPERWQQMAEHRASSIDRKLEGEFEAAGRRVYQYRLFTVPMGESEHHHTGQPQTGIVLWDVSEHRELQEQLIQAEKLASLGTLVSGMAHEINNPVQGILAMAEIIVEESDPERVKEYARDIIGYSKHVATVVYDLAAYARPVTRNCDTKLDIRERMLEAVKMVRRCPNFGDVQVVTQFEAIPPFTGRQAEIDQLFVNLISNAVQAMNGHGQLLLAASATDDAIMASVTDTGCGIPAALRGKIFDPFFTTKDPGKGTGLGLSIAYKIVKKYDGRIAVTSQEGKGSTFTVTFPVGQHTIAS